MIDALEMPARQELFGSIQAEMRNWLTQQPMISEWTAASVLLDREIPVGATPCWGYPVLSFAAERGSGEELGEVMPATLAVFCQLLGIHLIDDLLDEDPDGLHNQYGVGPAANLASAFQGLAASAIGASSLPAEKKCLAHEWMGSMQVTTSRGQHLDWMDVEDEVGYWRVARAKTPPLFSFALALGALFSQAEPSRCLGYHRFGESLGLMVQICDDLRDALASPATSDWTRRGTSLPILYARTTDHPERGHFRDLLSRIDSPSVLKEAQEIVVRCGAFSYCCSKLIELAREALERLESIAPRDSTPLEGLVNRLLLPVVRHLENAGVSSPESLIYRQEQCST